MVLRSFVAVNMFLLDHRKTLVQAITDRGVEG